LAAGVRPPVRAPAAPARWARTRGAAARRQEHDGGVHAVQGALPSRHGRAAAPVGAQLLAPSVRARHPAVRGDGCPMREPQITRYLRWLEAERGLSLDSYDALWRWSVNDLRAFWASIWDWCGLDSPTPCETVLADERMPGARWFVGTQVNYARQVFRHADAA